ncbi:nitrous oxide reductase [Longibacter salinarum]|uniref:Nitrous oxide reductase n=1 Tax=Longibacter salinarum TaxID=1850348 RepID=A0A2A8CUA7_9BACT|nr:nitrous oxide reductase family maturation protein NosD [Longibacter salinarum]PEN11334.1 nitrous oxide reductase [Longibacter salinarum]
MRRCFPDIRAAIALLAAAVLLVGPAQAQPTPQTLTVSPDGPIRTISKAIKQARPGAHITVRPGTYREPTIVIETPGLTLEGTGRPVIDGEEDRQLIHVRADSVTIRGLDLRNVGTSFTEDRAAIKVEQSRGCVIENNRLDNAFFGIWIGKSEGCRIAGNELQAYQDRESMAGNGIQLWYSRDMTIENNTVRGHRDGIYFEFVEESTVTNNHSEDNLRYGLHFMYSDHCRYENNLFRENGAGVAVMFTRHVEMIGNRFVRNWGSAAYGLLLKDIYDSTISGNEFIENTIGVYSENSTRVEVTGNTFRNNGWGAKVLANSQDNLFAQNNFIGNSFDVTTNSQQNPNTFRGNYWSAYTGYDLDRDGVGDVPYRPVRLFAYLIEKNEPSIILMRSLFVDLLDAAERVVPTITPETLVDARPSMHRLPLRP